MEAIVEKTTKEDQKIARQSISKIRASQNSISNQKGIVKIKLQEEGDFLSIPQKALFLLLEILDSMAEGKSITLIPSEADVSTQQAADILHVSRPHLVKLLEKNQIEFKKVGIHRRIALKDLIKYEQKLNETRQVKLQFLTAQAQELNLGY